LSKRPAAQGPDHDAKDPPASVAAEPSLEIHDQLPTLGLALRNHEQQVAAPEPSHRPDDLEDPKSTRSLGSAQLFHLSGH